MEYKVGDTISGIISGIKPYGVFIKVDNISAFCHISNLSHKFINNIFDEYRVGQTVSAKIIKIDENNRIEISFKDVTETIQSLNKSEHHLKAQKQAKTEFKYESNINSSPTTKSSFEDMLNDFLKKSDDKQKSIASRNMKRKKH